MMKMMRILNNPKIPLCVKLALREAYAIQMGELDRIERYQEELIEFETNMRTEVERGTFFDNIGKLI